MNVNCCYLLPKMTTLVQTKVENFEEINEENLILKNKTSYKYVCDVCGKNFHFRSNYEKHLKQYVGKHNGCKSLNKGENVGSNKCEMIRLKNNCVKKNEMESVDDMRKKGGGENGEESENENDISSDVIDKEGDEENRDFINVKGKKCEKNKYRKNKINEQIKIYKCQECLELFSKYLSLSQHLKLVHNKQGKVKCEICDEDFTTNEEYLSHMSLHGPEDKIICKGCRKVFDTLKSYYVHAKQNPRMHCFVCRLCYRKFATEFMLDMHVCICQNGKPLHCACGREFTRYQDVINHSKGTKPFSCCSCPHLANSLTAYIRHLRKHSKQKPYQCDKCNVKFAVIDFLNIHNKKYHSESENKSSGEARVDLQEGGLCVCSTCSKRFITVEELEFHKNLEHENKSSESNNRKQLNVTEHRNESDKSEIIDEVSGNERVQCPDCGKLLKRNRLENHRNTHKTSASLCPKCGKLFDTRFKLTQHVIAAHNNEPVRCEVCSRTLKTKKILNEHMKTHLKSEQGGRIPQAICPMCGLGLAQKGSLARHILLTHEKHKIVQSDKTYTCQECSEVLPNRVKYYSHRRMHRAMVDRFPCDVCGREFNKKQNLKRHVYLLHDETRVLADPIFKCQFCTRCFREKKNLRRHYSCVHRMDDVL